MRILIENTAGMGSSVGSRLEEVAAILHGLRGLNPAACLDTAHLYAAGYDIGSEAGLSLQADDSSVTHPYLLQANQTDLEFLLERARQIRYELAVDGENVLFRPVGNAAGDVLTLSLEDDLRIWIPAVGYSRHRASSR